MRRLEHGHDVVFTDPFIAEVINTMHPDVVRRGYTAVWFRETSWVHQPQRVRDQLQGCTCFMAYFTPIHRWQDVTTYPWRRGSPTVELKTALRTKWGMLARPQGHPDDACVVCGVRTGLEYDHVDPTFDEITVECLALMTADEKDTLFGYDKFQPETISVADFIPDTHPAVLHLLACHRSNVWQWLCRDHHRAKTATQRQRKPSVA